jgi:hypothetical protein
MLLDPRGAAMQVLRCALQIFDLMALSLFGVHGIALAARPGEHGSPAKVGVIVHQ